MEHRIALSDNSMAIMFKLLRIQYALMHQDEVDKQDIFLMGAKDVGPTGGATVGGAGVSVQQSLAQNSLAQNSIDIEQNSIGNSVLGGGGKRNKGYFGIDVPEVVSSAAGKQPHSLLTFDKNCMQCGGPG